MYTWDVIPFWRLIVLQYVSLYLILLACLCYNPVMPYRPNIFKVFEMYLKNIFFISVQYVIQTM